MNEAATIVLPRLLPHDPASEVVRAALEVHRGLGPGLEVELYQRAMELELEERGLKYWRNVFVDLDYKGRRLGRSRVPLLADGVLVGIRVQQALTQGDAALLAAQAKSLGVTGVLVNFGGDSLELRRVRPRKPNGHA